MLNPQEVYQRNQVMTARPEELTLMLYNGAIKFLHQAKLAIEKKDITKANSSLVKTQDILTELMTTLNLDYEISNSLLSLYDYMKNRLVEANIAKDIAVIIEIENMLFELKNTWATAMKQGLSS
ncbi:flagellar export chaperone FliS [Neobacillus novalis]|uniref:Flagellar export chaperone FliS n=1 Tax=Neobacillus novalis TaxID=220687 RepID=A0AA95MVZ1_9BACI|nr:flagellar export chaperone FliS [Neobacillus novalis]WHY88401.1 flagellar export chaperone FliS [Neobacillus novalis]